MRQRKSNYCLEDEDPDELAHLPPDQVVTGEQLKMKPGQKLSEKARELGCSVITLRMWHLEWRGSGYNPDYAIRRGSKNTKPGRYAEKDWPALIRAEIEKGHARHIGDVLLACGITAARAQVWSQRYAIFEQALWKSGVAYPKTHWRDFIAWLRLPTIDDYCKRRDAYIAEGVPETEAMHRAADEAVNALKHKTRQRRRVERDTLLGVSLGEEQMRRYRNGGRLRDAYSKRIAKKLLQVSRWTAMERAMRECAYDEAEIKEAMTALMGEFSKSETAGQAKWARVRKAILRRRAEADALARAQDVEAEMVKGYTEQRRRSAPIVAAWAERKYSGFRQTIG